MDKKIIDYLEFEVTKDWINITETLEYYLEDTYSKEELWEFIKKLQNLTTN